VKTVTVRRWKMLSLALLFAAAVLGTGAPEAVSDTYHAPANTVVQAGNALPPCCPPYIPVCPGNTIWG